MSEQNRHNLSELHALIVGLAREGQALARFLAEQGAHVTITDAKPAGALAAATQALADLSLTYALGGHPPAILDRQHIVFVSPGVPLDIPLLVTARQRGLPPSSETRLFTHLCPAPIIGITGSGGKTTTTALTGEILRAAGRRVWMGGNLGRPLLGHLHEIDREDIVVMELSSFQLELFGTWEEPGQAPCPAASRLFDPAGWSPSIAAILNITPNHLDRHHTMAAYTAAKTHILNYQRPTDIAVLNYDNPVTRQMGQGVSSQVHWFSLAQPVAEGAFLQADELIVQTAGRQEVVCRTADLHLLGHHNVANALAALALASAAGTPREAMHQAATSFHGVAHRLELVREQAGVAWYNDSIATAPERTVAALNSFDRPIVLLAGGRDKHLPWGEMAALTWEKARHLILFGESAQLIERAMQDSPLAAGGTCRIHHAAELAGAVDLAARLAQPGDVVLLAPGGTSFDAYADFEARGEHFRQLVNDLE